MLKQFEDVFNELQYASPVKARQLLRELEAAPERLAQFCRQARKISPVRATALVRILAGVSNPEYLLLLKDYATGEDETLRDAAFGALTREQNSAHKEVMLELLKSENSEIREKACSSLGKEIDSEVAGQLQQLLDDDSVNVIRAALLALAGSVQQGVFRRCERLLAHPDSEIKLLSLHILENAGGKHFAFRKITELLNNGDDERVQIEACRILAGKDVLRIRDDLVRILLDHSSSDYLRQEVLSALSRLPQQDAFGIIFNMITTEGFSETIIGEARKVLGRFDPGTVLAQAEKKFAAGTDRERLEIVRILGMYADKRVLVYFKSILLETGNRVVLGAIIEQLASYADIDIWEYLMRCLAQESGVVAYAAAQAASRLLVPERLLEFSGVLARNPSGMIAEIVLKRLVYYGRDRGLPAAVAEIIRPYLAGGEQPVNFFAIDAAGYVAQGALVKEVFRLIGEYRDSGILDEITASIMRGVQGSVVRLLEIAGESQLQAVSAILSRVERRDITGSMDSFFSYLADMAEKSVPGARLCLTVAASRFNREYIEALDNVGDKQLAYLLYTWSLLSRGIRDNSFYDWGKALSNPRIAVRMAALRALMDKDIEKYIMAIADMAFCDSKSEIREEAARVLRRVFNTRDEVAGAEEKV